MIGSQTVDNIYADYNIREGLRETLAKLNIVSARIVYGTTYTVSVGDVTYQLSKDINNNVNIVYNMSIDIKPIEILGNYEVKE